MVKPEMIHDVWGDGCLSCPKCKEPVHFPLVKNPEKHKPKKCSKCGEEFDWEEGEEK